MNSKEELEKICWTIFKREGCYDDNYKLRLERELKEIEVQMECDYFLDLFKKSVKFPKNDNNIFVAKLLRLVDDFDINKESEHVLGEFPDIDMDFIKVVRDYLKNVWAPIAFGKDNVCAIGNYTTFGIKSSLIDMVRVHDKDRSEILSLTTKIGLKDDDGKNLTFDKALETYKELKEYCDRNPDVADSARRLMYRNRGKGKHAGGLIIANCRIDNLVPLIHSKDDDDNADIPVSAFVEGLHGQDLGPLGLIKFDMLVINLMAICKCCKIIQDTRGVASICALPGQPNWSDLAYLDDPAALKLANDGKLKGVFQFDSQGIRELAKKGGVTAFEDLVAYNALYRPGPMGMGMHDVYVNRKRGREKYKLHPILEEILGMTYGVMCFQEQVMKILNRVGGIPDMHCEIVRKAISKKKVSAFIKYKEMFLENGQKTLGWDLERVNELWSQIESFAEYGFNKSHAVAYSYISARCLWLKAHYPIEFFSAILSTINSSNKMKEYKTEAESMGIDLRRVNINKSKERFTIVDGMIYMGFSNIKGIGDEVAERIVAGQPYTSVQDFLIRFGTDARVLEPFIGLNVFGEDQDPAKLFEYYEYFKDQNKKNENRRATFKASCEKYVNCIKDILNKELYSSKEYVESCEAMCGSSIEEQIEFQEETDGYIDSYAQEFLDKHMKLEKDQKEEFLSAVLEDKILGEDADTAWTIVKRYKKSVEGQVKKEADGYLVPFEEFEFRGKLEDKIKDFLKEPKPIIEAKHYGFSWQHLLEFSSDYDGGHTFADFDENEATLIGMIEVHIIEKPKTKVSKKGKGITYYTVLVEDANSRSEMVIFWEDDYNRFQEELNFWEGDSLKGHFLKIRLKKPDEGFSTYGFDAPPKMLRHSHVPKNKEDDNRIIVMSRPKVAVVDTDREIMKMFKSPIIIE